MLAVWDVPTRLFHWIVVVLVVFQWWSADSSEMMDYHVWGGYAVLVLVLFRLIWGFIGSKTARFSNFISGPKAVLGYIQALFRGETPFYLGHNPMGGWSIVVMLILLFIQATTGLFANDDIFIEGPLYGWVSKDSSDWLTTVHRLGFNLLLLFIAVHISAVLFYLLVKRENLIYPMLSGRKFLPVDQVYSKPSMASPWLGLGVLIIVIVGVWLLIR
ncbi:MAG: hypothetical protein CSA09_02415 [Candidatus Contendobacter odensis]|uniref:Cytochrome b561 bacterial/Ni-hydrogenase domain-containing protein n=1 Tax=Candidatus Contendibacter odensensis TaxID=1400860 RepID=A0A2G6PFN1_9GAMM|nr:MAG: hypothetical protein CSA09_02415 [Candidatus Contendobacter odensis]